MADYTVEGKEFLASIDHYCEGIHGINTGPAPGCPDCMDLPEVTCNRPDCYSSEPCEKCEKVRREDLGEKWWDLAGEGSFSWHQCDTCGSRLGGKRYPAHAHGFPEDRAGEYLHMEICTDCVLFFASGDVPESWSIR